MVMPLASKRQEFVVVVFILLLACGDLGGKSLREVTRERVETVEDISNAFLGFDCWYCNMFLTISFRPAHFYRSALCRF